MVRRAFSNWVLVPSVLVFGALLACKVGGSGKADINCKGEESGINCSVKHTEGSSKLGVCWNVKIECANGTKIESHACQDVDPSGVAERMIPKEQIVGWDTCDKATSFVVTDAKVETK